MRKKFLVLMAVTILIFNSFAPNIAAEENVEIIFSETFEGDLSRWELTGDKARKNISIYTEDDSYIGSYVSIKTEVSIEPNSFSSSASASAPELKSPLIDVVPGEKYTLAIDIKDGAAHKAQIVFLSNDSIILGSQDCAFYTQKENWGCYFSTIEIPDSATQMQIRLTCKTDGKVSKIASYDNIIVCKGKVWFKEDIEQRKEISPRAVDDSETVLKAENIVFRDTFESKNDNWTSSNAKATFEISSDDSATGKKSLLLTKESMKPSVSVSSKSFAAIPNAEYTLSLDARSSSQNNANVHLRFFDAENKQLHSESITTYSKDWKSFASTTTVPADAKTAQIYIATGNDSGKNYIDNIKVTSNKATSEIAEPTKEPEDKTPSKYEDIRKNSTILLIGSPNAIVNGEKTLIDSTNDKVVADIVDSRTLVPVRFIAETYNADVLWDGATNTVTLKLADKTVTIVLGDKSIKINDQVITIDVPAQSIEGRTMLPLRAFVEQVMDKTVFWDARGLIVITDDPALNAEKDTETIDKL